MISGRLAGDLGGRVRRPVDCHSRPQALTNVFMLVGLVVAAYRHAPAAVLIGLGVAVGVSVPQIGAFNRARWTALLRGDRRLDTALAVESLIEEAVFVVDSVLVAAATAIAPGAGLLIAVGPVAVGCGLFLAQRSTEPPIHPGTDGGHGTRATAYVGLWVLIAVFLSIGALFGLVGVGIVALTRELGRPGVSGAMLAAWAGASLISGVVFGSRAWRIRSVRRFLLGTAAMIGGSLLIAICTSSLTLSTMALVIAGLANAPTLITGNTLVTTVVPDHACTEAYTWLGVTVLAGIAVGATTRRCPHRQHRRLRCAVGSNRSRGLGGVRRRGRPASPGHRTAWPQRCRGTAVDQQHREGITNHIRRWFQPPWVPGAESR